MLIEAFTELFFRSRLRLSNFQLIACYFTLAVSTLCVADQSYQLNSGDKLEISVWQEEKLHAEVVVQPDGTISFPLVGQIPAAGKTTDELVAKLQENLGQYIQDPEIDIRLIAAEGNAVYVIGEVVKPGAIIMKGPTDIMQALSMAGGLTPFAKKNDIKILRRGNNQKTTALTFEYGDVEDGNELQSNMLLRSGDTVIVP